MLTEALPAGVLPGISAGLGVGEPAAGQAVTIYALTAIPPSAASANWPRKRLLLTGVDGFAVANTVTTLSPDYTLTMVARFVAGVAAGLVWALLAGYARRLVPDRQGKAIAIVMAGIPLALSLGRHRRRRRPDRPRAAGADGARHRRRRGGRRAAGGVRRQPGAGLRRRGAVGTRLGRRPDAAADGGRERRRRSGGQRAGHARHPVERRDGRGRGGRRGPARRCRSGGVPLDAARAPAAGARRGHRRPAARVPRSLLSGRRARTRLAPGPSSSGVSSGPRWPAATRRSPCRRTAPRRTPRRAPATSRNRPWPTPSRACRSSTTASRTSRTPCPRRGRWRGTWS
ncbi:major facilitator superfamily permease [Amycolatopsis mediterranei S699]|uniref:Major facilitator superfamily permease n=1 Tax=Amycolatopsis mediterranei (strain S699) TaxID=713604 RepID=A0A9R0UCM4_AMYMS|nr:major facilitator superfamily permease [Amycolatopsis mediterranei S699]